MREHTLAIFSNLSDIPFSVSCVLTRYCAHFDALPRGGATIHFPLFCSSANTIDMGQAATA